MIKFVVFDICSLSISDTNSFIRRPPSYDSTVCEKNVAASVSVVSSTSPDVGEKVTIILFAPPIR